MRRIALLLLACAALPAVALAARDPHAEKRHHTRADMALARRVLLRQADVPDWTRVAVPTTKSTLECTGFDTDFSRFTITGEAKVAYSFRSLDQIMSTSAVFRSRAQAIRDFQLAAIPELAGCLRHAFVQELRASTPALKILRASARVERAPKVGERAAAYRLTATVSANGARLRVYVDLLVFQRGRTQAGLTFTGIGAPVPSRPSYARVVDARLR